MFSSSQKILVTGASSGIGKAIASQCVASGATVLAQGRDTARLRQTAAACACPERWISVERDFAINPESIPLWMRELAREHGKLWGMAHCAGTGIMDTLGLYDFKTARGYFDLNFHVPMLLAKGFADRRVSQKGGAMLFLSSSSAVYPEKGHLMYGAAKAALACAIKSISQELSSRGLRAHCLAPGIVQTPMEAAAEDLMGPAYREEQLAKYPLGFGLPEDVANMAVFLLSEKARWITGQNFVLDGGCN